MAFPFMPMTAKTIRKVSGAIKDSNLSEKRSKINGKFESEQVNLAAETNPRPLKKTYSNHRTQSHH